MLPQSFGPVNPKSRADHLSPIQLLLPSPSLSRAPISPLQSPRPTLSCLPYPIHYQDHVSLKYGVPLALTRSFPLTLLQLTASFPQSQFSRIIKWSHNWLRHVL